jgi:hypothetical protein
MQTGGMLGPQPTARKPLNAFYYGRWARAVGTRSAAMLSGRFFAAILVCLALAFSSSVVTPGIELKEKTIAAFNHYVQVAEAKMQQDADDPQSFLWIDRLPEPRREEALKALHEGHVLIERLHTRDGNKSIPIPDGLVHHWIGTIFVPGVCLDETIALVENYDGYAKLYKPTVQRSELRSRQGDVFRAYLRLHRKTIVSVTYNEDLETRYSIVDGTRAYSQSHATRIAEVEDAGRPNEREKPVGNDHGYLWRLNTYSRYEQRDGGVYIQTEFISLSRSVPFVFAWLVNPYLKSIPRDYLISILESTRRALQSGEHGRPEARQCPS